MSDVKDGDNCSDTNPTFATIKSEVKDEDNSSAIYLSIVST